MPEMNGDELVTKLLETKIKVILMGAIMTLNVTQIFILLTSQ